MSSQEFSEQEQMDPDLIFEKADLLLAEVQSSPNKGQIYHQLSALLYSLTVIPESFVQRHQLHELFIQEFINGSPTDRPKFLIFVATILRGCTSENEAFIDVPDIEQLIRNLILSESNTLHLSVFINSICSYSKGADFFIQSGLLADFISSFSPSDNNLAFLKALFTLFKNQSRHIKRDMVATIINFILPFLQCDNLDLVAHSLAICECITCTSWSLHFIFDMNIWPLLIELTTKSENIFWMSLRSISRIILLCGKYDSNLLEQNIPTLPISLFVEKFMQTTIENQKPIELLLSFFASAMPNKYVTDAVMCIIPRVIEILDDLDARPKRQAARFLWRVLTVMDDDECLDFLANETVFNTLIDTMSAGELSLVYIVLEKLTRSPKASEYSPFFEEMCPILEELAYSGEGYTQSISATIMRTFFPDLYAKQGFIE